MAKLKPLIKLRKFEVDEKQRILASMLREAEEIEGQKRDLYARLKTERDAFNAMDDNMSMESRNMYGLFEGTLRADIARVDEELQKLTTRINLAQDEVRKAFEALKQVEIVHDRQIEEEKHRLAKKESDLMDEIGIEAFHRNQKN